MKSDDEIAVSSVIDTREMKPQKKMCVKKLYK